MRMIKRGERGFTLIELLIVVAILGVLAAVVIPNVGRFFGRGEDEARRAEKHNVESAIVALMTENALSEIPNAIVYSSGTDVAVNDMTAFPDPDSNATNEGKERDPGGTLYEFGSADPDIEGYLLYGHDIEGSDTGGSDNDARVNYVTMTSTKYYYTCEKDGTVRQWSCPDTSDPYNEFTD